MNWPVYAVSAALVVSGSVIAVQRALLTETPLVPKPTRHVWDVEFEAELTPGRGALHVHLPTSGNGQEVLDAQPGGEALNWTEETDEAGRRVATWHGAPKAPTMVRYRVRMETLARDIQLPKAPARLEPPDEIADIYLETTPEPLIEDLLPQLGLPPKDDPAGRARTLYAFVEEQIATETLGSHDPNEVLTQRYGSPLGKARLLAELAREAELPARVVLGIRPDGMTEASMLAWTELWLGGWVPMEPSSGIFAERPRDLLALRIDDGDAQGFFDTSGKLRLSAGRALASPVRYSHRLAADEMVALDPFFGSLSLYSLPLSTQSALRLLLLLPLGALVVSIARIGVGLKTFGGFLPVLLAVAFRETSLLTGLALTAGIVVFGILGRAILTPLNLLHFPRSALILCMVVVGVVGSALIGERSGHEELLIGVLFPIVIMSLLIERFSLTLEEEGLQSALARTFTTAIVIAMVHPVLSQPWLNYILFAFPELLLVVMGLLVLVGGYTGYRLLDYWRFRNIGSDESPGDLSENPA